MKLKYTFLLLLFSFSLFSQRSGNVKQGKEWSKDGSLFGAKSFIFRDILGASEEVKKFAIIPLYAASSEELTTVFYNSEGMNKSGLVFCFYGSYWNDSGVLYTGYGYKNLDKAKALIFLDKIQDVIDSNEAFLKDEKNINNLFFKFEDISVLIYHEGGIKLRLYWGDFDSTWDEKAFYWTKKRFEREL